MKVILLLLISVGFSAHASRYTYFPDSQLYPGAGYDIFRPDNAFPDCVDSDGIESGNHNQRMGSSDSSRVSLKLLKTREDFYQFINFSASMGGSYKFFSGSASYSMEQEDKFHSDSITWAVMFETNYGIYRLKNPRLKSAYKDLPIDRLRARCGREVVLKTRKAVSVFATFTLKNVDESHRREIRAKLDVSMRSGIWDAKLQTSYTNILRTALAKSELELEVWAVGGKGIVNLKELVTTGSKDGESPYELFARVPKVLEDYIGNLGASQAAPVEFYTGDIANLADEGDGTADSLYSKQLSRMYLSYVEAEGSYQRIRNIMGIDRSRYNLTDEEIFYLNQTSLNLNEAMNKIEAAALKCKGQNSSCEVPNIDIPYVNWPKPIYDKCERQREIAVLLGCITPDQSVQSRMKNEIPACIQQEIDSKHELIGWAMCRP